MYDVWSNTNISLFVRSLNSSGYILFQIITVAVYVKELYVSSGYPGQFIIHMHVVFQTLCTQWMQCWHW